MQLHVYCGWCLSTLIQVLAGLALYVALTILWELASRTMCNNSMLSSGLAANRQRKTQPVLYRRTRQGQNHPVVFSKPPMAPRRRRDPMVLDRKDDDLQNMNIVKSYKSHTANLNTSATDNWVNYKMPEHLRRCERPPGVPRLDLSCFDDKDEVKKAEDTSSSDSDDDVHAPMAWVNDKMHTERRACVRPPWVPPLDLSFLYDEEKGNETLDKTKNTESTHNCKTTDPSLHGTNSNIEHSMETKTETPSDWSQDSIAESHASYRDAAIDGNASDADFKGQKSGLKERLKSSKLGRIFFRKKNKYEGGEKVKDATKPTDISKSEEGQSHKSGNCIVNLISMCCCGK